MHALKKSEANFEKFGEAYFSFVNFNSIKGWKKHKKMILNLVVPIGKVKFVFFDDRETSSTYHQFFEITLSQQNYKRLTVEPGIWMAFEGLEEQNLVLNIANIEHTPSDTYELNIDKIDYKW
jgi:dTDP-4-dehydrorhamnose 3,5-epimerase